MHFWRICSSVLFLYKQLNRDAPPAASFPLRDHFSLDLFAFPQQLPAFLSYIRYHEPNGQIRKRKEQRNNRDAAAGWTGGWKTGSFVWITPGILHSAVSTCLQNLSRTVADQLRDLLMLMIQFDRFHINSPVGGGNANYSSASFSFSR